MQIIYKIPKVLKITKATFCCKTLYLRESMAVLKQATNVCNASYGYLDSLTRILVSRIIFVGIGFELRAYACIACALLLEPHFQSKSRIFFLIN
jgi:hypothetical protein